VHEGTHKTKEEVGAKFDKKLKKRSYKVLKDRVKLVGEENGEEIHEHRHRRHDGNRLEGHERRHKDKKRRREEDGHARHRRREEATIFEGSHEGPLKKEKKLRKRDFSWGR